MPHIKIIHSEGKQDCKDAIQWLKEKQVKDVQVINHDISPALGQHYRISNTPVLVRENEGLVFGERKILSYLKGYFG